MNQTENKSTTRIGLIVVGIIVVLTILGGAVYALIQANQPKPADSDNKSVSTSVPTADEIDEGLKQVKATAEAEKADRKKAKALINDQLKRIKLSN